MSNEKEMSALEWYHQQIVDRQNGNGDSRSLDEIFEQAKEIFEQQIKNAFARGNCLYGYETTESMQKIYYEKTYGGNK